MIISLAIDDGEILAAFARISDRMGEAGMKPALAEIGEHLAETTKQRFAASTAPDGMRWAANKPATLARKKGTLPLVASGQLADGIRHQFITGGVAVGTNRFAALFTGGAAIHQFGSKDDTIPARPFLGLSRGDRAAVLDILREHLAGGA